MNYQVQYGDSPAIIAHRYGVPLPTLIHSNPQKPTALVAGQLTWRSLMPGERITVPVGVGSLGAARATIRQGSSGPDVTAWQQIIGVTADGQFGPNTAAATKAWQASHGLTADGVVGPMTWAAADGSTAAPAPTAAPAALPSLPSSAMLSTSTPGPNPAVAAWQKVIGVTADGFFGPATKAATQAFQSAHGLTADGIVGPQTLAAAATSVASAAAPVVTATSPVALPSLPVALPPLPAALPSPTAVVTAAANTSLSIPAGIALAALAADPNYCVSVGQVGSAVNTAVHNFKTAWNAANPSNTVPVGTGKYEPIVATALSQALGGVNVPPGCGATAAPSVPSPVALPSLSLPSLPTALPPIPVPLPTAALPPPPPAAAPTAAMQPAVTPPAPSAPISKGAMIAGAVGVAALIGLVAVAASGKHTSTSKTTTTVRRAAPRRKNTKKKRK